MAFKFRDLIVTVVPRGRGGVADSGSGCAACSDAGSATVGSCTSECGVQCLDSGELFGPYQFIDPPYQLDLRQLLIYGLAKSNVKVPVQSQIHVLEEQMRPRTLAEIEALERQLADALRELREYKTQIEQTAK
jgi:hypothetical protein